MFIVGASSATTRAERITDFIHGTDKIEIHVPKFSTFADIQDHAVQVGANTVITFSAGNSLTLNNVNLNTLSADDFILPNDFFEIEEFDFFVEQVLGDDAPGSTVTGLKGADGSVLPLDTWVILPSGARAMLLATGELYYDPNSAFDVDVGETASNSLSYTTNGPAASPASSRFPSPAPRAPPSWTSN